MILELLNSLNTLGESSLFVAYHRILFPAPAEDQAAGSHQEVGKKESRNKAYVYHGSIRENPLPSIL